jgi:hypothetical protein
MSTSKKNTPDESQRNDGGGNEAVSGAMLVAWARRRMHNESASAQDCAPIARMCGALNPIAARNFICASWRPWMQRIENILRCR